MTSPPALAILGGAGPLVAARLQCALLEAYQRATGAQRDEDFPAIFSLNQAVGGVGATGVEQPERTRHHLARLADLARPCGAQLALVPCASLNPWTPEDEAGLAWVHWVDEAAEYLRLTGATRVGVMGSRSARRDGVFRVPLQAQGLEVVELPDSLQADADAIIWQAMSGQASEACRQRLERCHAFFRTHGCDAIWWGCTEFSVLPDTWRPNVRCVGPMDAMVASMMRRWVSPSFSLPAAQPCAMLKNSAKNWND